MEEEEDKIMSHILGSIIAKECDCVIAIREHESNTERFISYGASSTRLGLVTLLKEYIEIEVLPLGEDDES